MPNAAAQAYARVANSTSSPRDIEAQALLMAANKLQDVITNADPTGERTAHALMFNRKLWSVFLGEALNDENPQPVEIRQQIANIGIFVLTQRSIAILPRVSAGAPEGFHNIRFNDLAQDSRCCAAASSLRHSEPVTGPAAQALRSVARGRGGAAFAKSSVWK